MFTAFHIFAGAMALISGSIAFYALKGGLIHRKSGLVFTVSMLIMAASGAGIAVFKYELLNVVAGSLTFYLVATAFLTVRRPKTAARSYDISFMILGFLIAAGGIYVGIDAINNGDGTSRGSSEKGAVIFGSIALIGAVLDAKMLFFGGVIGKHRLLRHLWRMGFSLFLAAASFFLGQSQVIPEAMRHMGVLVGPVLIVILLMFYWIIRIQFFQLRKKVLPS